MDTGQYYLLSHKYDADEQVNMNNIWKTMFKLIYVECMSTFSIAEYTCEIFVVVAQSFHVENHHMYK